MTKTKKRKLEEGEIIPISNDYIFTELLNNEDNVYILEWFLSTYLNKKIELIKGNIKLLPRKLNKDNISQAKNEVDLLVKIGNEQYNIELNNRNQMERNVTYVTKIHSRSIKEGDKEYSNINKTYQINLNNYRCNEEDLIEEYNLRDKNGKKLTEKLQIDQIDMVKAKEICYCNNEREEKIRKWCMAINAKTCEELRKYLGDIMDKNDVERLIGKIQQMSFNDQYADLYIEAELHTPIAEMVRNTEIALAKKEGLNEGIEQGILQTAKNMLDKNMDIVTISEITGLSIEKIESLK